MNQESEDAMTIEDIKRIAVVGGGVMGNGIAHVCAISGFEVTIVDVDEARLARSLENMRRSGTRLTKAGKLSEEEAERVLARVSTTVDLEEAGRSADHVIEAVPEKLELKQDIFRRLDATCREEVILATNTSQFSITAIASATHRPDKVVGTHWANPPVLMRLIEIVRGVETSDRTIDVALALSHAYGKETIVCQNDSQGFVTARLMIAFFLEAQRILQEGIATVDDINKACRLAFNHAMGPLDTCDLGGLDTCLAAAEAMHEQFGERFLPPQNLRALVNAGHLGRKTGRGFRNYGAEDRN
jgi:3-hydroxybutyryl-CoA dehydrogenase